MSKRIADTTWDDLFGAGLLALIIYIIIHALPFIIFLGILLIGSISKIELPDAGAVIGSLFILGLIVLISYLIYKKKWKVFLYTGIVIGSIFLISKITYWILVAIE